MPFSMRLLIFILKISWFALIWDDCVKFFYFVPVGRTVNDVTEYPGLVDLSHDKIYGGRVV